MPELLRVSMWLACVILVGWAPLSVICKAGLISLAERVVLSYAIGIGFITAQMALMSFLGVKFSVFSIMIWWIPFIAAALLIPPHRWDSHLRGGPGGATNARQTIFPAEAKAPLSIFEKLLICGISFEVIYAFFRTLIKPMESYDSIAIYALKAKIFYIAKAIPHDFFSAFKGFVPHIEYPLLIPLAETSFYTFSGSLDDLAVKAIFPLYYVALITIFYYALRRFLDRRGSILFTFALATIPQVTDFATNGYADLPLAFYYFASLFYLLLWMRKKDNAFLVISFISSAFMIWTKSEGLMYALINAFVAVIYAVGKKSLRREGGVYAALSLLLIAAYLYIWRLFGLAVNSDFTAAKPSLSEKLIEGFGRIPAILYEYQIQFFGPKRWNIIWILFIIGFIAGYKKAFKGELMPVTVSIILALLGYTCVYMISSAPQGIGWHLSTSGSRLFLHFTPVVVLWLALLFTEFKLKI